MSEIPAPRDRRALLEEVNRAHPEARVELEGTTPFGALLSVESYRFGNGMRLLVCEDHSAPVLAYHTWYSVGSRHEREGKTGLAHLFEHLMFNEVEGCAPGEIDRIIEAAGGETNAATWFDWTHYTISLPATDLQLVIDLEARRMTRLVLQEPQVTSEKEVAANERRYRVEDDVEGSVSELLWATALTRHPYRQPTIGWMPDILGLTLEDCAEFYRTYYAPNNATVVVVGDVEVSELLPRVAASYASVPSTMLPLEDTWPEPAQVAERRLEVDKPTPTEKLVIGYHSPAFGDPDHLALTLLSEVLFAGRASRLHRALVRELELASEVRSFLGPFRDPGLMEIYVSARAGTRAEQLLEVVDRELDRVAQQPVSQSELERARARLELALVAGLETVEGKASTLGFYDVLLNRPAGAFERLEAIRRLDAGDVRRVARRYLTRSRRTLILVRPSRREKNEEAE